MNEKTNLGVKPLGRQGVISSVVEAEIVALKNYGLELRKAGPANTEAAALAHRKALLSYSYAAELAKGGKGAESAAKAKVNQLKSLFDSLNLPY